MTIAQLRDVVNNPMLDRVTHWQVTALPPNPSADPNGVLDGPGQTLVLYISGVKPMAASPAGRSGHAALAMLVAIVLMVVAFAVAWQASAIGQPMAFILCFACGALAACWVYVWAVEARRVRR